MDAEKDSTPAAAPEAPPAALQELTEVQVLAKRVEAFTGILDTLYSTLSHAEERILELEARVSALANYNYALCDYLQAVQSQDRLERNSVLAALANHGHKNVPMPMCN